MSLQDLAPANSQRARQTAVNAFHRYLACEGVTMGFIASSLLGDENGAVFVKLMDRYAVHLAFLEGRGGKLLARNSAMSYYRHVKNWLLDGYPKHRASIEKKLLKTAQTLENHCISRQEGSLIKKATACSKRDLRVLMDGLYYDASSAKDYQDAALLALMWYGFGRASDLSFVPKSSLSVTADGVIFVRLTRAKTSEEQGLSLFPDKNSFITYPLHAIGVALVMQNYPATQLLDIPLGNSGGSELVTPPVEVSLEEALLSIGEAVATSSAPEEKRKQPDANLKMHGYVNRVLKSVSEAQAQADLTTNLISHSFRRGGAQHANADPLLSAQWIFDRGSWNMTSTNKAFAYVFNATSEDQKVSRFLSDWDANSRPFVPDLSYFDSATKDDVHALGNLLFQPCISTTDPDKKLDGRVAEVLLAVLLHHLPEVLDRYPMCLYAGRVRECLLTLGISKYRVLIWSSELQRLVSEKEPSSKDAGCDEITRAERLINHQNCVIAELVALNQDLLKRMSELERRLEGCGCQGGTTTPAVTGPVAGAAANIGAESKKKSCRSKALPKSPVVFWYEWYAKTPRLWDACTNRQEKSTYKQITNYMKLFLPNGFALDPSSASYCDEVMATGKEAETGVYDFFCVYGIKSRNGSAVLKQLRKLHRDYVARVNIGGIRDPAPSRMKDLFQAEV